MRPKEPDNVQKLYECYGCGKRFEAPDTLVCSTCGSDLRNISRSRDL